ncbi:MAG TPA: HAD family hydrolase [Terriglobia bacterium]|nr:HAD family hydrolase [Terriglobia bacterium]
MPLPLTEIRKRARKVKLLLMDVDGVLTNGHIYYVPSPKGGFIETKGFHSRDGLGIRIAHEAGMKTGIVSGRGSPVVDYRIRELGIHFVRQHFLEKLDPYQSILKDAGLSHDAVCYIGDDLVDLPILKRAGLAVGVSNGHPLLRRYVHYVTRSPGGAGAVRETIELILAAKGKLKPLLKHYTR